MTVTEKEAKDKWCPMVRYSPINNGESYREATTHTEGCIGSGCMMWVWATVKDNEHGGYKLDYAWTGKTTPCQDCNGIGSHTDEWGTQDCDECEGKGHFPEMAQRGYCGLAGKQ